ncbi:MAG: DUF4974 domain-containing protein [Prolixibacteraceae bacterium]|jgi:ferric-dicitrate binding protein FerR (iron transport regulator)|nr:DUF4974 domain-containing protein [Prolixibacteraceae bacterium]
MEEKFDYNLLRNYAQGKYSYHDYKQIASYFGDSIYQEDIESAIRQHWDEFAIDPDNHQKDLSKLFETLKKQIQLEHSRSINLSSRLIRLYSRIAAVLLIPLIIYTTFTLVSGDRKEATGWAEIYSPPGARTHFTLPDGSNGWLNSSTKLKYPINFRRNRRVNLSGEAYFEVSRNKEYPFTVTTPNLDVKVLGTIFSISALEEENTTEVVLQEGKVVVSDHANGLNTLMIPNQKFEFDNLNRKYVIRSLNAAQYNAWKDGLLVFRNEPLDEVFKRLGRWYNVKITVTDERIKRYKYRATFCDEPIEEVIRLIALTLPIEFNIQKRAFNEQGIYEVKEITIRKK